MASLKGKITSRFANPIETASSAGSNFVSEAGKTQKTVKDQFSGISDDFFSQLLGLDFGTNERKTEKSMKGEMRQGQEITLSELRVTAAMKPRAEYTKPTERKAAILPGIDYRSEIVHAGERLSRKESRELEKRIEDITVELKRLISSSQVLSMEFSEITVQTPPVTPGKYHLNFFEWLLIEIRRIRMKVEDAGAWLSVMKSKKSQRKYGVLAKKHGTTFTLSGERSTATQTG